jgi:hypothetical protein
MLLAWLSAYESVRWTETRLDCEERHAEHQLLLGSPLCSAIALHSMGFTSGSECDQARRALRLSPMACTIQSFWRDSEPYRLYHSMAESPLTLVATLLLLLYAAYKWSSL